MKTPEKTEGMFQALVDALCRAGHAGKALAVAQIAANSWSVYLLTKKQVDTCVRACIRQEKLVDAVTTAMCYRPSERAMNQLVNTLVSRNKDADPSGKIAEAIDDFINSLIETQQFSRARDMAKLLGRKPLSKAKEKRLNAEFLDQMF